MAVSAFSVSLCAAGQVHTAAKAGDTELLTRLINAKPGVVRESTENRVTPLHSAVQGRRPEAVRLLLDKGAPVDACTRGGYTPLHWAASVDDASIAALLVERGADVNARTDRGLSVLDVAVLKKAGRVLEFLILKTRVAYDAPPSDASHGSVRLKESAREQLGGLVMKCPENENVNFAYGMACLSLARYSLAAMAFQRVLAVNSSNERARFELARSYYESGQYGLAQDEFKTVLAGRPPQAFRDSAGRYMAEIDRRVRRWDAALRVEAGWMRDDNVNVGPDSETVNIAPLIFGTETFTSLTVDEASRPREADGSFLSIQISPVYDPGDVGRWLAQGDASCYRTFIQGEPDYECAYASFSAGPCRDTGRSQFALPARCSLLDSGGERLVSQYGVDPSYMLVDSRSGDRKWLTAACAEYRDYADLNERDGLYLSLGETFRYYYGPRRSVVFTGVTVFRADADDAVYASRGLEWKTGADIRLPLDLVLLGRLRYTTGDYDETEPLAPGRRKDTQMQFTVGAAKALPYGLTLSVSQQETDNNSTFGVYQYERSVTLAGISGTF